MGDFVHLHVHSEFSLLDGMSRLKDLVSRAGELGMDAIALTDHGVMYAAVDFCTIAQQQGIRPIIGSEMYVAARGMRMREGKLDSHSYHLILLVKDEVGYRNLLFLTTQAHLEGFYYKPRIDKELLAEHCEGLIALSACASGELPRLIQSGQMDEAREAARWYRDTFGDGNFYLELQQHEGMKELQAINAKLAALGKELSIPLVATNDVHYVLADDAEAQELLLAIQTGTTMSDPKRMRMGSKDFYLRSPEEMAALFAEYPDAVANTVRIAERCNFSIKSNGYHLPPFEVPEGHTAESYLRHLCEEGLQRRYPDGISDEVQARLEHELAIIHKMGFDTYFLIVWDLVRFAQHNDILVGPGRGSAAGSIVAYALDITQLDPLEHDLIFERFLNPGRVTMPDIDLDFPDDRREETINYIVQKYGEDHVAQIATFGTMAARGAVRDVGRALGILLGDVDKVAKAIPFGPKMTIQKALSECRELQELYESEEYIRELVDKAMKLEGLARHTSTHAAGVVVGDKPLVEYTPLQRAPKGEGVIAQYGMEALESIGLLKIDILGLATLSVIQRTYAWIKKMRGITLSPSDIPLDDPSIYELLCSGEVTGIFQVESEGMRRAMQGILPSRFDDVVAFLSLYRPGPMKFIPDYAARKHGEQSVQYKHPLLEPILKDTFGIIVYQEQIIRIVTDLAGFTAGEADLLRRAVGKKKEKALKRQKSRFIKGALDKGIEEDAAEVIFKEIEYFANYGFNKAHSAAYAVITCQTAYLKANFPVEYMAALLSVERHNFDKIPTLVAECRRLGIEVLPPDVQISQLDFAIERRDSDGAEDQDSGERSCLPETHAIRFGLGSIKNVGDGPPQVILDARGDTPFADPDDFCRQADLRQVHKRALEYLIRAGALDSFGERGALLAVVDRMMSISQQTHLARESGQLTFFDAGAGESGLGTSSLLTGVPSKESLSRKVILGWEKELLGTYVSGHPLDRLGQTPPAGITPSNRIGPDIEGQTVTVVGIPISARPITTKKGQPMAFVEIEDPQGTLEITVFPRVYEKTRELWDTDAILRVQGRVQIRNERVNLICDHAEKYVVTASPPPTTPSSLSKARKVHRIHITLQRTGDQDHDVKMLTSICHLLEQRPGQDSFFIYVSNGYELVQMAFPNSSTHYTPSVDSQLRRLVGLDSVRVD